ncbi:hypothetical protein [Amycolatopsis suaedae]|uniref:Uncharacterized protein n=1 Tax=Amycolatopsis suaedae TaxID=2510978 RepID=A0A4Q7J0S2_9PSEU|nr:hypothetical protein [Amycolatopsis suaedae]RZQ59534.1 hypothetical protein EWH70_33635 [Amycolatopsis suaedae]
MHERAIAAYGPKRDIPAALRAIANEAGSLALAAGNDLKVVQAMLGRSGIVLTADTYARASCPASRVVQRRPPPL